MCDVVVLPIFFYFFPSFCIFNKSNGGGGGGDAAIASFSCISRCDAGSHFRLSSLPFFLLLLLCCVLVRSENPDASTNKN